MWTELLVAHLKNYPIPEGLRKRIRNVTNDNIPGPRVEHRTPEYEAEVLLDRDVRRSRSWVI
jgi:hypothetical protein